MEAPIRYIPHTAKRLSIAVDGKIFNHRENKVIETKMIDGHLKVEIDWIFGRGLYSVALLMLATDLRLGIPEEKYGEIEPMYTDGDPSNLTLDNIVYKFKNGPIETEHFPGYFHIPFYPLYALNKDGVMINISNGKVKKWGIMGASEVDGKISGYRYTRVIREDEQSRTVFRHRALALTFIPYGHDVKHRKVNHLDGFPGHDSLWNLEWCTHKENIDHAYDEGLSNRNKPVWAYNFYTKQERLFRSIDATARFIEQESEEPKISRRNMILHRLRNKDFKLYFDGWLFKYENDKRPWPEVDENTKLVHAQKFKKLFVRDVFTKEVFLLKDVEQAAALTNVTVDTILRHLRTGSTIPYRGYLFRLPNGKLSVDWPEYSEYQLTIFRKHPVYPPNGVLATHVLTGERTLYTSVKEACAALKTIQSRLWNYINNGKPINGTHRLEYIPTNARVSPKK